MIKEAPLLGHGPDGFQRLYMYYQADYLKSICDNSKLILADNINHPLSEFLIIAVNYGIVGLIVYEGYFCDISSTIRGFFCIGCQQKVTYLEYALVAAGKNRPELEYVLSYYKDDTLKLKAAEFLIENMPGHYSYNGSDI